MSDKSTTDRGYFVPLIALRLETLEGELVHIASPPRDFTYERNYPVAVSWEGRVFIMTFRRLGTAHIYREVVGERRRVTEGSCVIYNVE